MENPHWDAETIFRKYIYDYMVRKKLHDSAKIFKEEANLPINPVAINDSSQGLLLEWWSIFSDMYFKRQSNLATEQAFIASLPAQPIADGKYLWTETEKLQFSDPISGSKALPPSLNEKLIRQFPKDNWQFPNQANYLNEFIRDVESLNPLKMSFEHQLSIGSNPLEVYPTSTINTPTVGISHTENSLKPDQNQHGGWPFPQQGAWPFLGDSPSFMNLEHEEFSSPLTSNKVQKLQQIAGNYIAKDLPFLGDLSIGLSSTEGQQVDSSSSNQVGLLTQKDPQLLVKQVKGKEIEPLAEKTELIDQKSEQSTRKRKQPSNSRIEESFVSGEISGPLKIASPSSSSPSDASATRISTESKGENQLADTLNPTAYDIEVNANKSSRAKNTEALPSVEGFHSGNRENKDSASKMQEQDASLQNKQECKRKREQPSKSATEESFVSGDTSSPLKIASPSSGSPSSDGSAARISTESKGENHLADTLKTTDVEVYVNEGSQADNTESLPSREDFHDGNAENRASTPSILEQDTSVKNKQETSLLVKDNLVDANCKSRIMASPSSTKNLTLPKRELLSGKSLDQLDDDDNHVIAYLGAVDMKMSVSYWSGEMCSGSY